MEYITLLDQLFNIKYKTDFYFGASFLIPVSRVSVSLCLLSSHAGLFLSAVSPAVQNPCPHPGLKWRKHSGHRLRYKNVDLDPALLLFLKI